MNEEAIISIDLNDIFSKENEEKLDMLPKNLLIELLLRNLDKIVKSQERIVKAIDYIEKIKCNCDEKCFDKIINILKGDE